MAATPLIVKNFRTQIPGQLNDDSATFMFPLITSVNARGAKTEWRIMVRLQNDDGEFVPILDEYWDNMPMPTGIVGWIKVVSKQDGGKIRDSIATIVKTGKYKGSANATNVFCQTLRDALSLHNKQLKKSVNNADTGRTTRYPPMLAQILKDQKKPLDFERPVFVQRKYNGLRCVATEDFVMRDDQRESFVIMYSRKKHLFPGFQYIKDELAPVLKYYWESGRELYLDGEVYMHGMALQDISGHARREDVANAADAARINYMVYDLFIANEPNLTYSARSALLREVFDTFDHLRYCRRVETFTVTDMGQIKALYDQFIDEGYEGAMIRTDTKYVYSYNDRHCKNLLKMKETFDAEYRVVGWETGEKGKAAEALMIICEAGGIRFPVTPSLELADRVKLAKMMPMLESNGKTYFENRWLGQSITVYFDELSKDRVPQRARTKLEMRMD